MGFTAWRDPTRTTGKARKASATPSTAPTPEIVCLATVGPNQTAPEAPIRWPKSGIERSFVHCESKASTTPGRSRHQYKTSGLAPSPSIQTIKRAHGKPDYEVIHRIGRIGLGEAPPSRYQDFGRGFESTHDLEGYECNRCFSREAAPPPVCPLWSDIIRRHQGIVTDTPCRPNTRSSTGDPRGHATTTRPWRAASESEWQHRRFNPFSLSASLQPVIDTHSHSSYRYRSW